MFLFTYFLLFILVWWIIFFISLPIKINIPTHQDKGHASSAPIKTYIGLKVFVTSALSLSIMFILILFNFKLSILFKK